MQNVDLFSFNNIEINYHNIHGEIKCEDCFNTMSNLDKNNINMIVTSPPYNTTPDRGMSELALSTAACRYDGYKDYLTRDEYKNWTIKLFESFDRILKENGCIAYNFSYGSNESSTAADMIDVIHTIIEQTNFTLADIIIWKKPTALPNNVSPNKLTRVVEYIYIFVRKDEINTFISNKQVTSVRDSGQKMYSNIYNFIEAPNNDGDNCPLNKATYSTKLVSSILNMYAGEQKGVIYDPFMGSGTTAIGVMQFNKEHDKEYTYLGSELSQPQVDYANDRINKYLLNI